MSEKSSYKGFYGIMKGIVTRTDDPEASKNNNRKRIQVCIPSYHGDPFKHTGEGMTLDTAKTGTGDNLGIYPWAQVCSNMFNGNSSNQRDNPSVGFGAISFITSIIGLLTGGLTNNNSSEVSSMEMLYPSVLDYVWLMFEGGDIRCPVYMGSLSADIKNQESISLKLNTDSSIHTSDESSLGTMCYKMIASINEYDYNMISNASSSFTRFGILGWKEKSAKDLFTSMRNAGQTTFDLQLSMNSAEKFLTDLNSSSSWSGYKVQNGSNIYNALLSILSGNIGRAYQDSYALTKMNELIGNARSKGLTSQATIMMYVHTSYNGFEDIANYCANKCSGNATLDNYYKYIMDRFSSYSNTTKEYRKKAYNYITNLVNSGKIVGDNSANISDPSTPTGSTPSIASTIISPQNSQSTVSSITPSNGANTDAIKPKDFKQYSGSWANQMFGPGSYQKDRTYAYAACSVTAMADIVWKFADSSVTPKTIGDLAVSWGYRTATSSGLGGSSNTGSFYKRCANLYGFKYIGMTTGQTASYNKLCNALNNGMNNTLTIIGVKNGRYSANGHFVTPWKINGNYIYICDPGASNREKMSLSDIKSSINTVYIFQKN